MTAGIQHKRNGTEGSGFAEVQQLELPIKPHETNRED